MVRNGQAWVVWTLCIVAVSRSLAWGAYGGGKGTAAEPYLIYTPEQLNAIGANQGDWEKCFRLMADLDMSGYTGTQFKVIGLNWKGAFMGTFDGNGKTISNFTYTCADVNCVGLFGSAYYTAVIRNLGLIDPNIHAVRAQYVGALAGDCGATVTGCYVRNAVVSGEQNVGTLFGCCGPVKDCNATGMVLGSLRVGGLSGYTWDNAERCSADANVTGDEYVGGLTGWNNGTLSSCFASGTVSGTTEVGGLVGCCDLVIRDSYSNARVGGDNQTGGLVGSMTWDSIITNCYSVGKVTGRLQTGGFIGLNCARMTGMPNAVKACFWDTRTSGQATSDGGTGLDTALMQIRETFTNAGWDFVGETANGPNDVWRMAKTYDYPRLAWEPIPTESEPNLPSTIADDFEDGSPAPLWQVFESSPGALRIEEVDGKLELNAPIAPVGAYAFYLSSGWTLDSTKDFSMKVSFQFSKSAAGQAYVSIGLTPTPDTMAQYVDLTAACLDGQPYYTAGQTIGSGWQQLWAPRQSDTGTLYISYDAQGDQLFRSFTGYGSGNVFPVVTGTLKKQWAGRPLHVVLGGSCTGMTLTTGDCWLDNFVVDTGTVSTK